MSRDGSLAMQGGVTCLPGHVPALLVNMNVCGHLGAGRLQAVISKNTSEVICVCLHPPFANTKLQQR